ncbi:MAG: phosphoribosylanthranilate isomerase [Thermacetogeniaceae bacterium]|jgi:phosphoribosylanthranilate isomerase
MARVKICGITTLDAALAAVEFGADALGFVFAPSPRRVTPQDAERIIRELPPFVSKVGVFVDAPRQEALEIAGDCRLDVLQFHGGEAPDYCRGWQQQVVKAFRVRDGSVLEQMGTYDVAACLLDAYVPGRAGGTGQRFDWDLARQAGERRRIILAGGITPDNVEQAVRQARPYAIDVSSGVETGGVKDTEKIRALLMTVRRLNYEFDQH